jgi:hypothetical protein
MNVMREDVMAALVALLEGVIFTQPVNGATRFLSISRRLKLWSNVAKSQRPALFIAEHREQQAYQNEALPPKTTLGVDLFIYIDSSDPNAVPAIALNTMLDAIETALKPATGARQTLGGLVSHCRIDGAVLKDPGDLDGDGLLWIPLKILAV